MSVVKSRFNIPIPSTDLLTYLFDSAWGSAEGWSDDEPLIVSADGLDAPAYSFNQLKHLVKCFACGFKKHAGPGARVLVYGFINVSRPVAVLGAIGAEAYCNICPAYAVADCVWRLKNIKADYVFFAPQQLDTVRAAAQLVGLPTANLFILDQHVKGEATADGIRHWSYLLDQVDGPDFQWRRLSAEEAKSTTALLAQTTGTTGLPKIAERSHYALIGNTEQLLYRYHLKKRTNQETFFCTSHPSGVIFLFSGFLLPLKARYRSVFMEKYDLDKFLFAVKTLKPTSLHLPRHHLQDLLNRASQADFSSVTNVRSSGCIIPYRMCKEWRRIHGSPCEVFCGMSETGTYFAPDPREYIQDNTIGELMPNLEAKVVDENGQSMGRGQHGEIWIKCPYAMERYSEQPVETKALFSEDGFIKTGDLGMVDERGHWYISGRKKDLFKSGPGRVMAAEIEEALVTHPEITEAVVVPVNLANAEDDEPVPRGYLVREAGSTLSVDEFLKWMSSNLSSQLYLEGGASFLDALPISIGGKVDRNALREMATRDIKSRQKSNRCSISAFTGRAIINGTTKHEGLPHSVSGINGTGKHDDPLYKASSVNGVEQTSHETAINH